MCGTVLQINIKHWLLLMGIIIFILISLCLCKLTKFAKKKV